MGRVTRRLLRSVGLQPAVLDPQQEAGLLTVMYRSALADLGWFRSFQEGKPVDAKGRPLPWISYASLHFLEQRVKRNMRVFEYGSGNGTLWWATRVKEVVAVEHDREWYEQISAKLPANASIIHQSLQPSGQYAKTILAQSGRFQIVVVDGRDRSNCALTSIKKLASDGVIVWDNAERKRYREGQAALLKKGFRRIDFTSILPVDPREDTTSVFYRPRNCLGI